MQCSKHATKRPKTGASAHSSGTEDKQGLCTIDHLCLDYIDLLRRQEETKKKEEAKALDEGGQWVSLTAQVFIDENSQNSKWWAGAIPPNHYVAVKCAAANKRSFVLPGKFARSPRYRPVRSPVHVELSRVDGYPIRTALDCLDANGPTTPRWYADQWTQSVDVDAHMVELPNAVMGQGLVAGKLFCSETCVTFLEHAYRWIDNCLWLEAHPPKDIEDNWHCILNSVRDQAKHLAGEYDERCVNENKETRETHDYCDYDQGRYEVPKASDTEPVRGCSLGNFLDSTEAREASSRIRNRTSFCSRCSTTHFRKLYSRKSAETRIYASAEALCIACALLLQRTEADWNAATEYWRSVVAYINKTAFWRQLLAPAQQQLYLPDHWLPLPVTARSATLKRVPTSSIVDGVAPPRDTLFDDQWCQVLGSASCRGGKTKLEGDMCFVYFGDDDNVTAKDVVDYERRQLNYIEKDNYVSNIRPVACASCMEAADLAVCKQQFLCANAVLADLLCNDVLSVLRLYITSPYRNTSTVTTEPSYSVATMTPSLAELNAFLRSHRATHALSLARFAQCFHQFLLVSEEYPPAARCLAGLFDELGTRSLKLLDIGSGTGALLEHLPIGVRHHVSTYCGLEMNTKLAEHLRSRLPTLFPSSATHAYVNQVRWTIGSAMTHDWDVVLLSHCLYDMPNRLKHVKAAMQLVSLSRGGMVVIFHRKDDIGNLCDSLDHYVSEQAKTVAVLHWRLKVIHLPNTQLNVSSLVNSSPPLDDVLSIHFGLDVHSLATLDANMLRAHFRSQFVEREPGRWVVPVPLVCIQLSLVKHVVT